MPGDDDNMDFDAANRAEEDHTACQKQIEDLQVALNHEQKNLAGSTTTIRELRDTVASLRNELHKHGIGRFLEDGFKQLGFVSGSVSDVGSSASVLDNSLDVPGTLLDFSATCPSHKSLRLAAVTANAPSFAALRIAKNPYELAQGLQVSESLQLSTSSRALFFVNNSPLASTDTFEKPTEENLIRVMVKLTSACKERREAFADASFKKLVYPAFDLLSGLKLRVAERVRAELDGKKCLRGEPVLVLGGNNAHLLADFLGATFVHTPTVPDATVLRLFVWLHIDNDQFLLAQQSQLVPALRDLVNVAALWRHVQFIVLPVPYAYSLLPTFQAFMDEFNKTSVNFPNVLWLNDHVRVDGARFAHSLGSNAFVTYWTAVNQKGHLSNKSIRAALRFLRGLHPSLVPGMIDLSEPVKPEHVRPSGPSSQQSSSSSSSSFRTVQHGRIGKLICSAQSARGVPLQRGGGSGRGQPWNNSNRRNKGNRRN